MEQPVWRRLIAQSGTLCALPTVVDSMVTRVANARHSTLSKRIGAVYLIGEFGPGRNIGPSPTAVTPAELLTHGRGQWRRLAGLGLG